MGDNQNHINGWLVIDKPYQMGSTSVVSKIKWALSPDKIGHAGTLDPLASGVLPIALGKATKLIPYVMDGKKTYEFQITWGQETDTDDAEGNVIQRSDYRPQSSADVLAILPQFIGDIGQVPPQYSALKINGRRAYDLAREGSIVEMKERIIHVDSLELVRFGLDSADFRVQCGKGTYVRSLGRDIGRKLGCLGFISVLRRVSCGPFSLADSTSIEAFSNKRSVSDLHIIPMESCIRDLPTLRVSDEIAERLKMGQRVPMRCLSESIQGEVRSDGVACLFRLDHFMGLVQVKKGVVHPYKMF